MKNILLAFFLSLIFFAGCTGVSQQGLTNVPNHKFSYVEPSGWKRLFSSNAPMTSEDIKITMHSAVWTSRNNSTITVVAADKSSQPEKMSQREAIILSMRKWMSDHLSKDCDDVKFDIVDENSGAYDISSRYFELHSDITCQPKNKGSEYVIKTISYSIESMEFIYMFQLSALSEFYNQDQKAFQKMLESLNFIQNRSAKSPQDETGINGSMVTSGTGATKSLY